MCLYVCRPLSNGRGLQPPVTMSRIKGFYKKDSHRNFTVMGLCFPLVRASLWSACSCSCWFSHIKRVFVTLCYVELEWIGTCTSIFSKTICFLQSIMRWFCYRVTSGHFASLCFECSKRPPGRFGYKTSAPASVVEVLWLTKPKYEMNIPVHSNECQHRDNRLCLQKLGVQCEGNSLYMYYICICIIIKK